MNKERILELAKDLRSEALPKVQTPNGEVCPHFNMKSFIRVPYKWENDADRACDEEVDWCGTTCCVAGLTLLKWSTRPINRLREQSIGDNTRMAMDLLEIDEVQAEELFMPGVNSIAYISVSTIKGNKLWAARCLEKLAETGGVDWEGTRDDQKL